MLLVLLAPLPSVLWPASAQCQLVAAVTRYPASKSLRMPSIGSVLTAVRQVSLQIAEEPALQLMLH